MAPSLIYQRTGGRRVELYVPFEWEGKTINHIDIGPCRLDHLLRWQQGEFATAIAMLADMVGEPEAFVRQVAYPDTDRVLAAFVDMVPPQIQADIGRGAIPALAPPITPPSLGEYSPVEEEAETPEEEDVPVKPEPGWPYQGSPPATGDDEEVADLDLVGEG